MNTGIITKIEYRLEGDTTYSTVGFSGFTASYQETVEKSEAGTSYQLKIDLKIPRIGKTISDLLSSLTGRKLNLKFTDGNGVVHTAGNSSYPARLLYRESISGTAGSWNGYNVTITQQSPFPHTITES